MAANNRATESNEARPELSPAAAVEEEKSLRGVRLLTGYLGLAAVVNTLLIIIQFWATFQAGYVLTAFSFLYLFLSVTAIAALVWCVILLNRKSASALWAFTGFIAISFLNTMAVRLYGGKALFVPFDLFGYILQAVFLSSIYWLKRKDFLA